MKRASLVWLVLLLSISLLGSGTAIGRAQPPDGQGTPEPFPFSDRYPAEVVLEVPGDTATLVRLDIIVDQVRPLDETHLFPRPGSRFEPLVATVYINSGESQRLGQAGLVARPIPNESLRALRQYGPGTDQPSGWPTFDQWVARMQAIATAHPTLVRMVSIGQSVQGRQLWALKITDNPDVEEDEPEFRYISTMHGNEPVGAELTLRLADLLTDNYGTDPALTALVDGTEIWLWPIYNPDGYTAGSRWNAHGVDLNRDFPDRVTDPVDDPAGREPETQAFMNFEYAHSVTMGANYHTGALVVNYPWDSVPQPPDYAPDDALYYLFSVGYASRNPQIWNGGFPNGVSRGWEWYIIRGGLQDWAYYWHNEHHVTIEVSSQQPPPYSQMDTYWNNNRDAMLWWMGQALTGVRGLVTDSATGAPLDGTVDVLEVSKPLRTDPAVGDYHRMLLPGTYAVRCSADGYLDQTWTVQVADGPATVRNCAMVSESQPTMHVGGIKIRYQAKGAGKYVVSGSVRIFNESHQLLPGAAVSAQWNLPDGSHQNQQALTNANGLAAFRVKTTQIGAFQVCVTDVTKSGYVYDPAQNHETCHSLIVP
jgi:carboxypeptidase D